MMSAEMQPNGEIFQKSQPSNWPETGCWTVLMIFVSEKKEQRFTTKKN